MGLKSSNGGMVALWPPNTFRVELDKLATEQGGKTCSSFHQTSCCRFAVATQLYLGFSRSIMFKIGALSMLVTNTL